MKKYIIIAFLLPSFAAIAQTTAPAELKSMIQASFEYFPKFKELQQMESINAEKLVNIKTNQMPNVNGSVGYNYIDPVGQTSFPVGPGVSKTLQFQPNNNYNANIAANYVLYDFGRLKVSIEKTKEELNNSKLNTESAQYQLASQVSSIYYTLVYLKKAIQIQDSIILYYQQSKKLTQSRFNNGDALKVDLMNIQASIDNENNRKIDLENAFNKQLNLLEYTTGKNSASGIAFDFGLANNNIDKLISTAETKNAEISIFKSKLDQAKYDIAFNNLLKLPTVSVVASAGFRNGYQPDIDKLRLNYLAGMSLNVPIYLGGKLNSQTKLASLSAQQTEYSLNTYKHGLKKDIKQALIDIESNTEKLVNVKSQIESALSVVKLTQSLYKNGSATTVDISNATGNLQRSFLNQLQFEYQICISKIELAKITGEKYW